MIKKINIQNFKGLTREIELDRATAIIAPNWRGKSGVIDALRAVHLGYIPTEEGIVKTNAAMYQFASGACAEISTESPLGNGCLTMEQGKRGAVSVQHTAPEYVTEGFRLMLNPEAFFEASGPAKLKLLCALMGEAGEWTKEKVLDRLRSVAPKLKKGETAPEGFAAVVASLVDRLEGKIEEFRDIPTLVDDLSEALRVVKSEASATAKRMAETVVGLNDLAALDGEIRRLRSEDALKSLRSELGEKLKAASARLGAAQASKRERAAWETSVTVARAESEKVYAAPAPSRVNELREKLEAVSDAIPLLDDQEADLAEEYSRAKEDAAALELEAKEVLDSTERREWVQFAKEVPPKGEPIVVRGALYHDGDGCFHAVEGAEPVLEWEKVSKQSEEALAEARDKAELAMSRYSTANQLSDDLSEIRTNRRRAKEQREELLASLHNEEVRVAGLAAAEEAFNRRVEEAKSKLRELLANEPEVIDTTEAYNEAERLQAEIDAVNGELEKVQSLKNEQARIEQAQGERLRVEQEISAIKLMDDSVKELRVKIVDSAAEKWLEIANRFVAPVTGRKLQYVSGEIVWLNGGLAIPFNPFSGSEKALVRMAIGVALAAKQKARVVLLDELSRFDDTNKVTLIKTLNALLDEGIIDQYIVADCREIGIDDITVVRL